MDGDKAKAATLIRRPLSLAQAAPESSGMGLDGSTRTALNATPERAAAAVSSWSDSDLPVHLHLTPTVRPDAAHALARLLFGPLDDDPVPSDDAHDP
jgi:hypothetical protein